MKATISLIAILLLTQTTAPDRVFPIHGLNMYPRSFQRQILLSEDLELGYLRIPLLWQIVEPEKGVFIWDDLDQIVATCSERNIPLLITLRCISSWGTKDETIQDTIYQSGSPPRNMDDWNNFLSRLAARYKNSGVAYEIENEVNAKVFWTGTLEEYLDLLINSYQVIKQHAPDATVLHAAMACGITKTINITGSDDLGKQFHDEWLFQILSTKAFDVVNLHNYYYPSDLIVNELSFAKYIEHIKIIAEQAGVDSLPFWITEAGYISKTTSVAGRVDRSSPEQQEIWMDQALQESHGLNIHSFFWLLLQDREEFFFGSMGLMDEEGEKRPAWEAYMSQ